MFLIGTARTTDRRLLQRHPSFKHRCTEGAEPLGGSLAVVDRQLMLSSTSGISLWSVTVVPDAGGLQLLHGGGPSRGGQLVLSQAAPQLWAMN